MLMDLPYTLNQFWLQKTYRDTNFSQKIYIRHSYLLHIDTYDGYGLKR